MNTLYKGFIIVLSSIIEWTIHSNSLSQNKICNLTAKIFLFGSRVDDSKKGGDIDILILGKRKLDFIEKGKIKKSFFNKFGEQKIDLISFKNDDKNVFKKIALMEAIEL